MNKRTFKGLAAVVALLSASVVNAASITLTPSTTTVDANESFTLIVGGSGFPANINFGSLTLSWTSTLLNLTTTDIQIEAELAALGFTGTFIGTDAVLGPGSADITMDTPIGAPVPTTGGNIDFFTLGFTATAAMNLATETIISSGANSAGGFLDGSNLPITIEPYGSATLNAVPVPSAVWLFGSGLIGLAGIARRSNTKALG